MIDKKISISKAELALALGISRQQLFRRLRDIGVKSNNKILTPNELKIIDEFIGIPEDLVILKTN